MSVFKSWLASYWASFSYVGLVFATLFFSASVTPSLIPRTYVVQGMLSGFALAAGYGVGVGLVATYHFFELPDPPQKVQRLSRRITTGCAAVVFVWFLRQMTFWQNSTRELMEMEPLATAYPYRTAVFAVAFGAVLVATSRLFRRCGSFVSRRLSRHLPRRVAAALGWTAVAAAAFFLVTGLLARGLLNAADASFSEWDELVDEGVEQPSEAFITGSSESLVPWGSIGRFGKTFLTTGPTAEEIGTFLGREASRPVRVYVGKRSAATPQARAALALEELKRVGGFERNILVIATPTGTGWLDPGAVDTLEYLHGGDTAIVATQYSYLPSFLTIAVDPERSIRESRALFRAVYGHWTKLPSQNRPKLYLHGLSLGSLGSEVSADLYSTFQDPIQGALWSGPPFPSRRWASITAARNPKSPAWLPEVGDGTVVRFTAQEDRLGVGRPWSPIRAVYLQYASDPVVFFSPDLLFRRPDWLSGQRGPDVSPHLRWYPVITFLQLAFDMPRGTTVPAGYGHHYAAANYIDAWCEVTVPAGWKEEDTRRLKERFDESR